MTLIACGTDVSTPRLQGARHEAPSRNGASKHGEDHSSTRAVAGRDRRIGAVSEPHILRTKWRCDWSLWPGTEDGWRYRMLYPPAEFVYGAVEDIFGIKSTMTFHRPVVEDAVLSAMFARLHSLSATAPDDQLELERLFIAIIKR